jgi:hypothetical protein
MLLCETSGDRFASRTRFRAIPATIRRTGEISSVTCLYIVSPFVSRNMSCTKDISVNFIYTCLRFPSVWIIGTVCSKTYVCERIHSCISKAVRWGLVGSKLHTKVLHRSLIIWAVVLVSVDDTPLDVSS